MGIFDRLKKSKEKPVAAQAKPVQRPSQTPVKKPKVVAQPAPDSNWKKSEKKILKKTDQTDRLLLSPVVTEKATSLGQYGKYVFAVPTSANRIEIAKAVQIIYGVTPIKVNIINTSGKDVRYGRTDGRTKDWKKAIVTLKEGQKIVLT